MSSHTACIEWNRSGANFVDNRYSRAHEWRFDGGARVAASSSPHVVRVPLSDPANVDPEEAYVAALGSCHMLWFLGLAAERGFTVDRYIDDAQGFLEAGADGRQWIARVLLRPRVFFSGSKAPSEAEVVDLHHRAHDACFLANSVKTAISTHCSWEYRA